MTTGFDDDEGIFESVLVVKSQHTFEFHVHGLESRGQGSEIQNSCTSCLNENQTAVVSIPSNEDASIGLRQSEKIGIRRLRQSSLARGFNIVSQAAQKLNG